MPTDELLATISAVEFLDAGDGASASEALATVPDADRVESLARVCIALLRLNATKHGEEPGKQLGELRAELLRAQRDGVVS